VTYGKEERMKKRMVLTTLIGVCAILIVVMAIQSGNASDKKDSKGRIAAVVGARANAGTGYVWKLVSYDKAMLDLNWSGFQCDKGAPPTGCSGTFVFVFMPKKEGKARALLEYNGPNGNLAGRLAVYILTEKYKVTVHTEEVKLKK
jgi:predicted secreted protein